MKKGDVLIAKYNLSYSNLDNKIITIIKDNEYIVDSLFCSNYSDGIIVKGNTGPPMAYYYKKEYPFYTQEELRDKKIEDILKKELTNE